MNVTLTTSSDDSDDPGSAPAGKRSDPSPDPNASADADPPPPAMQAGVEIICAEPFRSSLNLAWIEDQLRAALRHIDRAFGRVSVQVLGDEAMGRLHGNHCGDESTTDVLTFPLSEPGDPIDVDLAVCADVAMRQAAARAHDAERELLLYCLHGLLHCAGYDDHTPEDFAAIHAAEDRILDSIGVGATFGRGSAGEDAPG